jgi:hypothetical protein
MSFQVPSGRETVREGRSVLDLGDLVCVANQFFVVVRHDFLSLVWWWFTHRAGRD